MQSIPDQFQERVHGNDALRSVRACVGDPDEARLKRDRLLLRAVERILTQVIEITASVSSHLVVAGVPVAPSTYRARADAEAFVRAVARRLSASP